MDPEMHAAKVSEVQNLLRRYKEDWGKFQKKREFASSLDSKVSELFFWMVHALKSALDVETAPELEQKAITDITKFLRNEEVANEIDSCIRWLILFRAAGYAPDDKEPDEDGDNGESPKVNHERERENERKAIVEIVGIIADMEGYLCFETPHGARNKPNSLFRDQCKFPIKHWQYSKKKSTPFHEAVSSGNHMIVQRIIHSLDLYCSQQAAVQPVNRRPLLNIKSTCPKELLVHVLRQQDSSKRTALQEAAQDQQVNLNILKELLKHPGIADPPDSTFEDALEGGVEIVVKTFLDNETLRARFVTSQNLIRAMELQHNAPQHEHSQDKSENATETEQGIDRRTKIVYTLVRHAKTNHVFNEEVVQKIIEYNLDKVWRKRKSEVQLDTSRLLHLAVFHQNIDFVKKFAAEYPHSVVKKALVPRTEKPKDDCEGQGYYPLWYNNKTWEDSQWVDRRQPSNEIRTELVTATIREIHKMQHLSAVLEQSAEKVHELCFDISQFDSKLYRVRHFAQSLISHKENDKILSYEPTIKYARFPPLDLHPDDKDNFGTPPREEHTEVFDILQWLQKTKKVSSIIELKVPDRLVNPHNELMIARYVKKFGVEILDWRFLDLSLSIFPDEVKSKISGIHLYSSGKRAAISHWLSKDKGEGLGSLRNLSWARIHVIQDLMSPKDCRRICRDINEGLERLQEGWSERRDVTVNSQPWNPTQEASVDLEEIAQRAFPKLARFISSYRAYASSVLQGDNQSSKSFRPTRVAILDNGILSMLPVSNDTPMRARARLSKRGARRKGQAALPGHEQQAEGNMRVRMKKYGSSARTKADESLHYTGASSTDDDDDYDHEDYNGGTNVNDVAPKGARTLWSQIKEGRSFVDDDNQVSPWLFASDPHGTQMANLICAIDPLCELYVAKVTDGNRYGITPHRVARAIEWAREKQVDIISMSFTMFEQLNTLHSSIQHANSDGIIMMCSSHDEGANVSDSWPAGYPETLTIAACDKYGNLPRNFDEATAKYDYKIHGLDVPAGAVPFLASTNSVSGSSAATAIASGLSSLILSCVRLTNPPPSGAPTTNTGKGRRALVEEYFKDMLSAVAQKYLLLEKFGNLDAKVKEGDVVNAEDIINKSFAGAYNRDRRAGR